MSGAHSDLGPELRQLAQSILDKLDPAVRLAAARAQGASDGPGRCQQVWCPVCALAALISGEQHPLLTVVADHSVALLTLVKAMLDDIDTSGGPPGPDHPDPPDPPPDRPGPGGPDSPTSPPGRYQHIPVSVEE
ncbi:hypothetical protein ACNUDN_17225 [Mycobacterium sp. smrl_JER01]|uniref:hypothetical protein n=1 Tax=Mycobacterium sp. smrl_JER01 TaxID=3402633 RepID=UPI003ACEBDE3